MSVAEPHSSLTVLPAQFSPAGLLALGLDAGPPPPPRLGPPTAVDGVADPQLAAAFPEFGFRSVINRGGSGTVYCAEHRALKRLVAVKILAPALTARVEAVARFEREIGIAGRLAHPGIVQVFDGGQREGIWFLAMELLEGVDFGTLARVAGPLAPAVACELIRQAALALHHAHEQGLVHRDLKPGNLMLAAGRDGLPSVRVLDFGLASLALSEGAGGELTSSGEFLGTVDYVAPEQISNPRAVDARADIYGLGATLYRLLAGAAPHQTDEATTTLYSKLVRIARDPVPGISVARADLPPGLGAVVDRMLAHDPADRFASARELAAALERFADGADLPRWLRQAEALSARDREPGAQASPAVPPAARARARNSRAGLGWGWPRSWLGWGFPSDFPGRDPRILVHPRALRGEGPARRWCRRRTKFRLPCFPTWTSQRTPPRACSRRSGVTAAASGSALRGPRTFIPSRRIFTFAPGGGR